MKSKNTIFTTYNFSTTAFAYGLRRRLAITMASGVTCSVMALFAFSSAGFAEDEPPVVNSYYGSGNATDYSATSNPAATDIEKPEFNITTPTGDKTYESSTSTEATLTSPNFEVSDPIKPQATIDTSFTNPDISSPSYVHEIPTFTTNAIMLEFQPKINSNGGGDSATITLVENQTNVTQVQATDENEGTTLVYGIADGADSDHFSINGSTGSLIFKNSPDFENPMDADKDNSYEVVVEVSDGEYKDTQTLTVNVTDEIEDVTQDNKIATAKELVTSPSPSQDEENKQMVIKTKTMIKKTLTTQSNLFLANQTDVASGGAGSGSLSGSGTNDVGNLLLETGDVPLNGDEYQGIAAWLNLNMAWSKDGDAAGNYSVVSGGLHYKINPTLLTGIMLQYDQSEVKDGDAKFGGSGWLVGPYLVTEFTDLPLLVDARMLWGKGVNEFSPLGTFTDEVDSSRMLARLKLSSDIELGVLTVTPNFVGAYTVNEHDAYHDSLGNQIDGQCVKTQQFDIGFDFTLPIAVSSGKLAFKAGVDGIYSNTQIENAGEIENEISKVRARIDAGLDYQMNSATSFNFNLFYDGIGASDKSIIGLNTGASFTF